jgi:hypothetical protein
MGNAKKDLFLIFGKSGLESKEFSSLMTQKNLNQNEAFGGEQVAKP